MASSEPPRRRKVPGRILVLRFALKARAYTDEFPSVRGIRKCDNAVFDDIIQSYSEEEVKREEGYNYETCGGEFDAEWRTNPSIPFNHIVFFRLHCRFFYERYYAATKAKRLLTHTDNTSYLDEEACYEWAEKGTRELEDEDQSILENRSHITHRLPAGSEGPAGDEETQNFRTFGLTFRRDRPREPEKERPRVPEKEQPREPEKERPREPEKERPREPERERPREPEKERPREPEKERPREPEKERPREPEKDRSRGNNQRTSRPQRDTQIPTAMAAKFPTEIRTKEITSGFGGDPQDLDRLDIQVYDLCDGNGYPAYYGGLVTGSVDEGWEYVTASLGKSNYAFGCCLCSKIAATMQGNAARWWEEYCKAGSPRPNCWKPASGTQCPGTRPINTVEVSLYNLLREEFSTDDDQQACIAELQRLKWDPTKPDALPFATFKSKAKTLALRAGYTSWSLQNTIIRSCIEPAGLRMQCILNPDEKTFWLNAHNRANTYIADYVSLQSEKCTVCGGRHETSKCRRAGPRLGGEQSRMANGSGEGLGCDWCEIPGHFKRECRKLQRAIAQGEVGPGEANRRGGPGRDGKLPQEVTNFGDRSGNAERNFGAGDQMRPVYQANQQRQQPQQQIQRCTTYKGFGHASAVCPSKRTQATTGINYDDMDDSEHRYVYTYMGMRENRAIPPPSTRIGHMTFMDDVDEGASLLFAGETIDMELFQNLTQPVARNEVIATGELEAQVQKLTFTLSTTRVAEEPTGPVWTVTKTTSEKEMMTIIDSGAVKAVVTRKIVEASSCMWTEGSDVKFIKADGTTYTPAGVCEEFSFTMGTINFKVHAYVVDRAPFQLLLGTQFLWATGVGIFPKWNRVVITVPTLMEFKVSTVGPTKLNAPPPITMGKELEEIEVDVGPVSASLSMPIDVTPVLFLLIPDGPSISTDICAFHHATAIVLGEKDLVAECDGPLAPVDLEVMASDIPTLSTEFVRKIFKFGPTVPPEVITQVCLDIIEFADAYSWHEFDLGCITDVPHVINVTDSNPVVLPSRPALYLP